MQNLLISIFLFVQVSTLSSSVTAFPAAHPKNGNHIVGLQAQESAISYKISNTMHDIASSALSLLNSDNDDHCENMDAIDHDCGMPDCGSVCDCTAVSHCVLHRSPTVQTLAHIFWVKHASLDPLNFASSIFHPPQPVIL